MQRSHLSRVYIQTLHELIMKYENQKFNQLRTINMFKLARERVFHSCSFNLEEVVVLKNTEAFPHLASLHQIQYLHNRTHTVHIYVGLCE